MRVVKILYLEDNPDDAFLFRRALKNKAHHYYVETPSRVQQAIQLIRTTPYDAIFTDLELQVAPHGDQLIESLVTSEFKTPLVILTNHNETSLDEGLQHLINENLVSFINKKSINAQELPDIVDKIISKRVSILHVDQDRAFGEKAVALMESASPPIFRVTSAASPAIATELLDNDLHFDAMMLDPGVGLQDSEATRSLLNKAVQIPHLRTSVILLTDRNPPELPAEIRRCLDRRSIIYCRKKDASAPSLANAILTQRTNRRVPDLSPVLH